MKERESVRRIAIITLTTFLIYLTIFITYMVLVWFMNLVNPTLLYGVLMWNYVLSLLPIPMFRIAKLFMPRGHWYIDEIRTNFVVYLYLVFALTFIGNWILAFMTRTTECGSIVFGLLMSLAYMCLMMFYFMKD